MRCGNEYVDQSVLAAFKQVLAAKLPDRKSGDVKLHLVIKTMTGEDVRAKMGVREVSSGKGAPAAKPAKVTRKVKPKSAPKAKAKPKKKVN